MGAMARPNYHANIMLDLECISVEASDPVLIELGAVYFDLDTGEELSSLKTPISMQSCIDRGLKVDQDTIDWVQRNIPETLAVSKNTKTTIEEALYKLSLFVRRAVESMKDNLRGKGQNPERCRAMVWGNGAVADNIWIRSAYAACGMQRPWMFFQDMCVRTFVDQAGFITGRKFPYEVARSGKHHDALDDCRHQVKYLVLARNALISIQIDTDHALGSDTSDKPSTQELKSSPTDASTQGTKSQPLRETQERFFQTKIGQAMQSMGLMSLENLFPLLKLDNETGADLKQLSKEC